MSTLEPFGQIYLELVASHAADLEGDDREFAISVQGKLFDDLTVAQQQRVMQIYVWSLND